jgi:hypothetical protein
VRDRTQGPKVSRSMGSIVTRWLAILRRLPGDTTRSDYQSTLVIGGQVGWFDGSRTEAAVRRARSRAMVNGGEADPLAPKAWRGG